MQKKIKDRQNKIKTINHKITLLSGSFTEQKTVTLEKKLSDNIVTQSLLFLVASSLLITIFIVVSEFFSKSFTTELQVSQYLNIRLIGTMQKINEADTSK